MNHQTSAVHEMKAKLEAVAREHEDKAAALRAAVSTLQMHYLADRGDGSPPEAIPFATVSTSDEVRWFERPGEGGRRDDDPSPDALPAKPGKPAKAAKIKPAKATNPGRAKAPPTTAAQRSHDAEAVLSAVRASSSGMSLGALAKQLDFATHYVKRLTNDLIEVGHIELVGKNRGAKYVVGGGES